VIASDDLTQNTLIIIAGKLPQFEVRPGQPFRRWVHSIARSQVQESFRQQYRRERLANELAALERAPSTKISSHLARAERVELVEQELDKLDSRYRRVIENDLQAGDASVLANREHIKAGSVRTRRRRAYQLLRDRVRHRSRREDSTPAAP
jgi:RNA polymerase sigma factor (sigma-70 family)